MRSFELRLPSDEAIVGKALEHDDIRMLLDLVELMSRDRPQISEDGLEKVLGATAFAKFAAGLLPRLLEWGYFVEVPPDPNLDAEIPMRKFRLCRRSVRIETFEISSHNAEAAIAILEGEDAPDLPDDFWESEGEVYEEDDEREG